MLAKRRNEKRQGGEEMRERKLAWDLGILGDGERGRERGREGWPS